MSTKIRVALILLFLFCGPVCDAKKTSPDNIAIRIALQGPTVCSGARSLTLERFITNVGSKEISISREWMLKTREYTVVYDMKKGFARHAFLQTHADSISKLDFAQGASVNLAAGSAMRFKSEIPLDKDFFQKPGFYKMRMHYLGALREQDGTFRDVRISSNWVLFEVESCRSRPAQ